MYVVLFLGAVNVPETEEQVQTRFLTRLEHLYDLLTDMDIVKERQSNARASIDQWYEDEDEDDYLEDLNHEKDVEIDMRNQAVILRRELFDTIDNLNGYQLYYVETKRHIEIVREVLFCRKVKIASTVVSEADIEELYDFGLTKNMRMLRI